MEGREKGERREVRGGRKGERGGWNGRGDFVSLGLGMDASGTNQRREGYE